MRSRSNIIGARGMCSWSSSSCLWVNSTHQQHCMNLKAILQEEVIMDCISVHYSFFVVYNNNYVNDINVALNSTSQHMYSHTTLRALVNTCTVSQLQCLQAAYWVPSSPPIIGGAELHSGSEKEVISSGQVGSTLSLILPWRVYRNVPSFSIQSRIKVSTSLVTIVSSLLKIYALFMLCVCVYAWRNKEWLLSLREVFAWWISRSFP